MLLSSLRWFLPTQLVTYKYSSCVHLRLHLVRRMTSSGKVQFYFRTIQNNQIANSFKSSHCSNPHLYFLDDMTGYSLNIAIINDYVFHTYPSALHPDVLFSPSWDQWVQNISVCNCKTQRYYFTTTASIIFPHSIHQFFDVPMIQVAFSIS